MPLRSILLIGFALILAGATAFVARSLLSDNEPAPKTAAAPVNDSPMVLVAARSLPVGTILKPEDLRWQSWPDDRLHERYLRKGNFSEGSLVGHVVRFGVVGGEPLTQDNLVAPGDHGFLAAALTPGMRAVTVPVDKVSGIAGFIFPGDRVDLILIHRVADASGQARQVSETVIQNLRVLAVDARTDDQEGKPALGKTVTVEATPKLAEKISLLQRMGALTLSLRSLAVEAQAAEGPHKPGAALPIDTARTHTWDMEVSPLLPPVNPDRDKIRVNLTRGGAKAVVEFDRTSSREIPLTVDPNLTRDMMSVLSKGAEAIAAASSRPEEAATPSPEEEESR